MRPGQDLGSRAMNLLATSYYQPDTVSFYNVVLFIHIAAAVIAFGGTFTYGLVEAVVTRPEQRRHLAFWHRLQRELGAKIITPAGIVIIVVLLGLGHAFFMPTELRAAEAAERDIEAAGDGEIVLGAEYETLAK